jgi:Geminivirus Rep catalytic domain.
VNVHTERNEETLFTYNMAAANIADLDDFSEDEPIDLTGAPEDLPDGHALDAAVADNHDNPGDELGDLGGNPHGSKGFSFDGKSIHATYPGHLQPELVKATAEKYGTLDAYSIVQETGSTGHLHTHAFFQWDTAVRTKNQRFLDVPAQSDSVDASGLVRRLVHPNLKKVVTNAHRERIFKYHQKTNPQVSLVKNLEKWTAKVSPKRPHELTDVIWACKTVRDLELHESLGRWMGQTGTYQQIKRIWELRPTDRQLVGRLRPWQSAIVEGLWCSRIDDWPTKYPFTTTHEEAAVRGVGFGRRGDDIDSGVRRHGGDRYLPRDGMFLAEYLDRRIRDAGMEWKAGYGRGHLPKADRKLLWIWDTAGNTGKSTLAKYLVDLFDGLFVSAGRKADLAHIWNGHVQRGGELLTVFNFSRSSEERLPWETIEQLLDGMVISTKYDSTVIRTPPVTVVCFANYPPKKADDGTWPLSEDRYVCVQVKSEDEWD